MEGLLKSKIAVLKTGWIVDIEAWDEADLLKEVDLDRTQDFLVMCKLAAKPERNQ